MALRVGTYATQTVLRLCQCKAKKPLKDTFEVPDGKAFGMNTGWEIRRCFDCGSEWAVDAKLLTT